MSKTNLIITTIFVLNLTHVSFLYTLKIAEITRFSDTYRGYSGTFSKSNITIALNVFMSNVSELCNVPTCNIYVVYNNCFMELFGSSVFISNCSKNY